MLFVDFIYYARCYSSIPRAERVSGAANNLNDQSEAKGTAVLSDLLVDERSEFTGKSAI